MCVPEFEVYVLLACVFGAGDRRGVGFYAGAVADAHEAQDAEVAGADAADGVLEEGAHRACVGEHVELAFHTSVYALCFFYLLKEKGSMLDSPHIAR